MQHTILILDDEKRICETLADYLTDMGHLVFAYEDGAAALDALRAEDRSGFGKLDHELRWT